MDFRIRLPLLLALMSLPASLHANAGSDIAVIVHPSSPVKSMSRTDLRPIFQTNKTDWDHGGKVFPINLPEGDTSRKGFDAAVLGLDPDRVARYWIDRKIRGGARPPKKVSSVALVLAVVSKKPEAIGYVPGDNVNKNVKVVARIRGGQVVAP
ncbi:MAG: hypothetical protein OXU20_40020 [Myxococcales bacterium]|nr:hypothetical protein [Myxococcales bacterium]